MEKLLDGKLALAKLRKQRERKVEIGDGKTVFFRMPDNATMRTMLEVVDDKKANWTVDERHVCALVFGWIGITEADLLGESIGASDQVEFDPELWGEIVRYDSEINGKVANAILKEVVDDLLKAEGARKNLPPGSPPGTSSAPE